MKVLGIDAATEACSAAIEVDGAIRERFQIAPRQHTQLLLRDIEALLADAGIAVRELDGIAYGMGPGAFTGVRLTVAVAQGLAFAHDLPLVGVCNLAATALEIDAPDQALIWTAFDARMGQIYHARFQRSGEALEPLAEPAVAEPAQLGPLPSGCWRAGGTGFATYGDALTRLGQVEVSPDIYPRARSIIALARTDFAAGLGVAADAAPVAYVRNQVTSA